MSCGRTVRFGLYALAALVLATPYSALEATPLKQAYELEGPGLSVAFAGAGLLRGRAGTLTVDVPGEVSLALLVWSARGDCRTDPATEECGLGVAPFPDQALTFDGQALTGEVAGFELRPSEGGPLRITVGYVADVTEAVAAHGPGKHSFAVGDADRHNDFRELEGAGLLVAYTHPQTAAAYRLIIFLGLDFAWGEAPIRSDEHATDPLAFIHGAAKGDRPAELFLFVGGAEAHRPDRIDFSHNDSVSRRLNASEGANFDAERIAVRIPGKVGTSAVHLVSELVGDNPDSLSWSLAALRLPLAATAGCSAAFWNRRTEHWRGVRPPIRVGNVFGTEPHYSSLSDATLRLALRFKDGPGLLGAAKELLREGTAALLNSLHPEIEFPLLRGQVVRRVGDALATRDPATLLSVAEELAALNTADCPLD